MGRYSIQWKKKSKRNSAKGKQKILKKNYYGYNESKGISKRNSLQYKKKLF